MEIDEIAPMIIGAGGLLLFGNSLYFLFQYKIRPIGVASCFLGVVFGFIIFALGVFETLTFLGKAYRGN